MCISNYSIPHEVSGNNLVHISFVLKDSTLNRILDMHPCAVGLLCCALPPFLRSASILPLQSLVFLFSPPCILVFLLLLSNFASFLTICKWKIRLPSHLRMWHSCIIYCPAWCRIPGWKSPSCGWGSAVHHLLASMLNVGTCTCRFSILPRAFYSVSWLYSLSCQTVYWYYATVEMYFSFFFVCLFSYLFIYFAEIQTDTAMNIFTM